MEYKRKINNKLYVYILILALLLKLNFCYIVLPFKMNSPQNSIDLTEIVNFLVNNELIITLPIGDPKTNIDFYASMNEYPYYLEEGSCKSHSISSTSYYFLNSNSYSLTKNLSDCIVKLDTCSLGQEKLFLYEDINLNKLVELYPFISYFGNRKSNINKNNKQICGKIGFQIENRPYRLYEYENFITMLKKNSKIISYSWYIHYYETPYKKSENEYYDGAIIFDVFNKKFYDDFPYFKNDNDYFYINVKDLERILAWTFTFDKIYYSINNSKIELNNRESGLAFEKDLILCTEEYFENIKTEFFNDYFDKKICFLVEGKYNYIYCDKTTFERRVKEFPALSFKSNGLNKTFILNGDDLFKEYNNNLLFMIVFEKYSYKLWTLGKIFMKKYNFYFDNDKKFIGCFERIIPKKNETKSFFDKIKWYIFIIIGIIIGFFLGKKIRDRRRKLRANELEDKFEYLSNKSINNNNDINSNTMSNYKEIKTQLYDITSENNN